MALLVRKAREEAVYNDTADTLREGLDANGSVSELYQNTFSSLVGVAGRTKGAAGQDALALVIDQAKAIGGEKGIQILEDLARTEKVKATKAPSSTWPDW